MNMHYNFIKNLTLGLRLTRKMKLHDDKGQELFSTVTVNYSQVAVPEEDFAEMIKASNAVCDNLWTYYKKNSKTPTLTDEEYQENKDLIREAVVILLNNLTDNDFLTNRIKYIKFPEDGKPGIGVYDHIYYDGQYETTITVTYNTDVYAQDLFYPAYPGAIINNFKVLDVG